MRLLNSKTSFNFYQIPIQIKTAVITSHVKHFETEINTDSVNLSEMINVAHPAKFWSVNGNGCKYHKLSESTTEHI